ncbi:MAG TPA: hypothetical protein PLV92_21075, partial [Pirellulaceae bacterium]|nr:hypothetical protein [Pirellulaceae bacterium]
MSRPQRLDDDRSIELWTRQLDGQPLNAAETADLMRALVDDTELRGVFDADDRLHGLLSASAKLGRAMPTRETQRARENKQDDEERFVAGVFAKLDRVAPQEVIPLDTVAVAPVCGLAVEPSDATPTNSATGAQGEFSAVTPVDGIRRSHGRRSSRSSTAWGNGGSLRWAFGWASAAALAVLCVLGVVAAIQFAERNDERPEGQPVAASSRNSSIQSPDVRRERERSPAASTSNGSIGPFDAIGERARGVAERNSEGENRPARPSANGVDVQPVVWRTGGPSGGRLLPGVHELAHGRARVRTADDLELDVA